MSPTDPLEKTLQALLEIGRERGCITYEQVNSGLPEGVSSEVVDRLLTELENAGIELVDDLEGLHRESDAQEQPSAEPEEETPDTFVPPASWPSGVEPAPLTPLPPTPPPASASGVPWPPGDQARQLAFFETIRTAPDDDAPRLVYADWLEDQGDPACAARAEFIRVQVELARMGPDDPRRFDLEERELDLLAAHEADWFGPFAELLRDQVRDWQYNWRGYIRKWGFERGFFTLRIAMPSDLLDLASPLFEAGLPVLVGIRNEAGCLIPRWQRWEEFTRSPYLGRIIRVSSFDMDGGGGAVSAAVAASPYLDSLASLDLVEEHIGPQWLRWLAEQERLARVPSLRLILNRNYLGDEALRILADSPNLACLTELHLGDSQNDSKITAAGVEALAGAAHLARLQRLTLDCTDLGVEVLKHLLTSSHLVGLRELSLPVGNGSLRSAAGFAPLADLDAPPRLHTLDLTASNLGDEAIEVLARCSWLGNVTTLRLPNNGISDRGAKALAGSDHLGRLQTLDLSTNPTYSGQTVNRISADGLVALLASPRLPCLRSLDLSNNAITAEGSGGLSWEGPARLRTLNLSGNRLRTEGGRTLGASPLLAGLETLDLSENLIGDEGAETLATSSFLSGLRVLRLGKNGLRGRGAWALASSPHLARLASLVLWQNALGDTGARLLVSSPILRDLRQLSLGLAGIGPEGARALATSPNLSRLLRLHLDGNRIGDEGVRALAASPYLSRLTELSLEDTGMSLEGLQVLARSPYLTRLTSLGLAGNISLGPRCARILQDAPSLARLTQLTLGRAGAEEDFDEASADVVCRSSLGRLCELRGH